MRAIISTVWFQDILVSSVMGIPYTPIIGTTVNEYLNIPIDEKAGTPTLTHYTIGIGKTDNDALMDSVEHSPIDITLYEIIPLLLVDKNVRSLDASELIEYALIKDITVKGVEYIACYARRIDNVSNQTTLLQVDYDKVKDVYDIDVMKFTEGMLGKPVPKLGKDYIFDNAVSSVAITATLSVILSLREIENVKNALSILYPNSTNYITDRILEIGILASNASNGYFQHTHYSKVNKYLESLTLDENHIAELDIGGMGPINI